ALAVIGTNYLSRREDSIISKYEAAKRSRTHGSEVDPEDDGDGSGFD
ncbi:MAG: hypothetical protein GWN18_08375, partial [Thermoplasmata archaeon]|nr:hypothetical protein [Thermoplasmata archaeon]NIS12060.1 hypothetical protein [Thermoplasmata archaeon]NIS19984.1 hypothetical protein [Thermoplasmata archaeon]NIT77179.1 hypothetical protein [Thermoplasmata archaeon]NIU49091.1 hypothetical protein [Thermoplasmata archaeon]